MIIELIYYEWLVRCSLISGSFRNVMTYDFSWKKVFLKEAQLMGMGRGQYVGEQKASSYHWLDFIIWPSINYIMIN